MSSQLADYNLLSKTRRNCRRWRNSGARGRSRRSASSKLLMWVSATVRFSVKTTLWLPVVSLAFVL